MAILKVLKENDKNETHDKSGRRPEEKIGKKVGKTTDLEDAT